MLQPGSIVFLHHEHPSDVFLNRSQLHNSSPHSLDMCPLLNQSPYDDALIRLQTDSVSQKYFQEKTFGLSKNMLMGIQIDVPARDSLQCLQWGKKTFQGFQKYHT